jgi:hypothetical protein
VNVVVKPGVCHPARSCVASGRLPFPANTNQSVLDELPSLCRRENEFVARWMNSLLSIGRCGLSQ